MPLTNTSNNNINSHFLGKNNVVIGIKFETFVQRREEAQLHQSNERSSENSSITSIDDNEIYSVVFGGGNKGNVYGLGVLSKNFTPTCAHSSTSQAPMVHQIQEMRETI